MPLRFPESKADFFIFDLDPPQDLPFSNTKTLAIHLRQFLENYNYHPLIKTSGSKGLHIFVPIHLEYSTEQIMDTCNELTKEFVNQHQDLCTSVLRKDKRDHKIS
jgi:bifunctional non-homologous end joining protein LigD